VLQHSQMCAVALCVLLGTHNRTSGPYVVLIHSILSP
jgi:hypothetical protein